MMDPVFTTPKAWVFHVLELAMQGDTASIEATVNATSDAELERIMHWAGAMPEWQHLKEPRSNEQDHS